MKFLVGIDDTDSSLGLCTTYLAYRIAVDLHPKVNVLPYPRLVRLNPNIPFKTRGNAAVCLQIEAASAAAAFGAIAGKVAEFSDVPGGANPGMVFLEGTFVPREFEDLYLEALKGVVNPHRVRKLLRTLGVRFFELGNGMGIVGAAASIGFDERFDHTYELISYRREESWGTRRSLDSSSVEEMDGSMFPTVFNSFDYQKKKVLVAPHGPDPVLLGVRGDSPRSVTRAYGALTFGELPQGHMVYSSNQHTDAHLTGPLEWKAYSSGWLEGTVDSVRVGEGGHVYFQLNDGTHRRVVAAYEPTGDLRRMVRHLKVGARVRASGGVRRGTSLHPSALNLEKLEVLSPGKGLPVGIYIPSPRANRHLTKPLSRYGRESSSRKGKVDGWLGASTTPRAPAGSRR